VSKAILEILIKGRKQKRKVKKEKDGLDKL
jgi:hypothetical protein